QIGLFIDALDVGGKFLEEMPSAFQQPAVVHFQGVASLPERPHLIVHVAAIVVFSVAALAIGQELDQCGSASASGVLDAARGCRDDFEQVVSICGLGIYIESRSTVCDSGNGHLLIKGSGIGVLIDLADDDKRQIMYRREVQTLIEVSRTGGSVAGEGEIYVRLAPHLERQGKSRPAWNPRRH